MPKPYTFPTLYDNARTLSIRNLKEWDYLVPDINCRTTITWSRGGEVTSRIGLEVNTAKPHNWHIILRYTYDKQDISYCVPLVSQPSNLGKGRVWYFVCPSTGKRCRKLYKIGGYFLHREAFKGCMYECQTYLKMCAGNSTTSNSYLQWMKPTPSTLRNTMQASPRQQTYCHLHL